MRSILLKASLPISRASREAPSIWLYVSWPLSRVGILKQNKLKKNFARKKLIFNLLVRLHGNLERLIRHTFHQRADIVGVVSKTRKVHSGDVTPCLRREKWAGTRGGREAALRRIIDGLGRCVDVVSEHIVRRLKHTRASLGIPALYFFDNFFFQN